MTLYSIDSIDFGRKQYGTKLLIAFISNTKIDKENKIYNPSIVKPQTFSKIFEFSFCVTEFLGVYRECHW